MCVMSYRTCHDHVTANSVTIDPKTDGLQCRNVACIATKYGSLGGDILSAEKLTLAGSMRGKSAFRSLQFYPSHEIGGERRFAIPSLRSVAASDPRTFMSTRVSFKAQW